MDPQKTQLLAELVEVQRRHTSVVKWHSTLQTNHTTTLITTSSSKEHRQQSFDLEVVAVLSAIGHLEDACAWARATANTCQVEGMNLSTACISKTKRKTPVAAIRDKLLTWRRRVDSSLTLVYDDLHLVERRYASKVGPPRGRAVAYVELLVLAAKMAIAPSERQSGWRRRGIGIGGPVNCNAAFLNVNSRKNERVYEEDEEEDEENREDEVEIEIDQVEIERCELVSNGNGENDGFGRCAHSEQQKVKQPLLSKKKGLEDAFLTKSQAETENSNIVTKAFGLADKSTTTKSAMPNQALRAKSNTGGAANSITAATGFEKRSSDDGVHGTGMGNGDVDGNKSDEREGNEYEGGTNEDQSQYSLHSMIASKKELIAITKINTDINAKTSSGTTMAMLEKSGRERGSGSEGVNKKLKIECIKKQEEDKEKEEGQSEDEEEDSEIVYGCDDEDKSERDETSCVGGMSTRKTSVKWADVDIDIEAEQLKCGKEEGFEGVQVEDKYVRFGKAARDSLSADEDMIEQVRMMFDGVCASGSSTRSPAIEDATIHGGEDSDGEGKDAWEQWCGSEQWGDEAAKWMSSMCEWFGCVRDNLSHL